MLQIEIIGTFLLINQPFLEILGGRGILCDDKEEYVIRFESISRFCHIHHIKQNKADINLEKWLTY